ncbi:tetratricopeptide repeat protein [Acinetobacter shaoyimingii]|uniref:Sel1 repeat family protein n=1 Tax=Acinetobacter shaoyimingii TaxID=2715164 RepID=A0A6G8RYE9_9GAMM|nr:tetratricopeptide repeat protein [Acinetobacter shaoyimingii]QIO06976.1 sel1 repeat family protein [Acinetobacter shaoyimingii]
MNYKKYYALVLFAFVIFYIGSYVKNNSNYLLATYHYKTQELKGDELNRYAALLYYKNIHDSFKDRHLAEDDQPSKKELEIEKLFKKSAQQGSPLAKLNLARLYQYKHNPELYPEIFRLLKESAELGNADAQFRLGEYYHSGLGTETDYQKAKYWYEKAVEQGNPAAMNNIGVLYQRGLGVEKNGKVSTEWYVKSANLGYSNALENMFQNYYHGLNGLPKDEEEAMKWREKCYFRTDEIPIQPVFDSKLAVKETYPNTCL